MTQSGEPSELSHAGRSHAECLCPGQQQQLRLQPVLHVLLWRWSLASESWMVITHMRSQTTQDQCLPTRALSELEFGIRPSGLDLEQWSDISSGFAAHLVDSVHLGCKLLPVYSGLKHHSLLFTMFVGK